MEICRRTALATAVVLLAGAAGLGETGRIEAVTVYRGRAEVVRVVPAPEEAGALEVVVEDLPEQIIPDSLYADAERGILVRAVRYRTQVVAEAPREEVRDLDRRIEDLEKQLRANQAAIEALAQQRAYLDRLQDFSASTAKAELEKGVLDAEQLSRLTVFMFEQRAQVTQKALELAEQRRDLERQIDPIRAERAKLSRTTSRTAREAIVFIEKERRGAAGLRLGYLVGNVEWTPSYNLRSAGERNHVDMEYIAGITQMSGEDWDGVRLTLSTATPTLASDAPGLAPLWVTLGQVGQIALGDVRAIEQQRREAEQQYRGARTQAERQQAELMANSAAAGYNVLYGQGKVRLAGAQPGAPDEDAHLGVNYALEGRHSLKSRADRQTVRILSAALEAKPFRLAVPALTKYVYRQAEVKNTSALVLLPGRCSAYLDGQFAGIGDVPLVRPGQRFMAGFGVDTQLAARQRLEAKDERTVGGNVEQTFTYQVLVENFSDKALPVRVLDRLPVAQDGAVRVSLLEEQLKQKLSADPFYLRFQRPHNILRWDVEAPAGATEEKAFAVEYKFRLEFDRKLQIVPVSAASRQQAAEMLKDDIDLIMNRKAF